MGLYISPEQAAFSKLDSTEEVDEEKSPGGHEQGREQVSEQVDELADNKNGEDSNEHNDAPSITQDTEDAAIGGPDNIENEPTQQDPEPQQRPQSPNLSRHSSVSQDSQREDRIDSPITSMDEDCKDRPSMSRRSSIKIQELVDKYDGLTKKADDSLLMPPHIENRRRSASRSVSIRSFRTDATSDFGDFEDAEDANSIKLSRQPSVSDSPRPSTSRAGRLRSASQSSLRNIPANSGTTAITSPIQEEAPSSSQDLRTKFGPISFAPNLELVDKLFDVEKLEKTQPIAKDYSLDAIDAIIKDNFTTVSERKTWYRISRPGTIRKHDLGDDDSYRRVTWVGSKVREDVSKTVRRWMTEGPYAGRATTGGRPKVKGGAFNWDAKDAKSEPISFDEIFGKRKSVQSPKPEGLANHRPLSLQVQSSSRTHSRTASAGVNSLPPHSPLSIPLPPAAPTFGWSSGTTGSLTPASPRPPSDYTRQSLEVGSARSAGLPSPGVPEPEKPESLRLVLPASASPAQAPVKPTNLVLTVPENNNNDDDDDDEWGEMVASPAVNSRPGSGFFDTSINSPMASLDPAGPSAITPIKHDAPIATTPFLPSNDDSTIPMANNLSSMSSGDIWDFSSFDSTFAAPAVPPTTTSKPAFDFDTPLQSPALNPPSRIGSPASFPLPHSPALSIPPRTGSPGSLPPPLSPTLSTPSRSTSPASFPLPQSPTISSVPRAASPTWIQPITKAPTPSVPIRPHHTPKNSLNLIRPSPLHNVITPNAILPEQERPEPSSKPASRNVSFVQDQDVVDESAVRRIVAKLPNLSYMLR